MAKESAAEVGIQLAQAPLGAKGAAKKIVVARVVGEPIYQQDIIRAFRAMPPRIRRAGLKRHYTKLLETVIVAKMLTIYGRRLKLENDSRVKRELKRAEDALVRDVYLGDLVRKQITEKLLKDKYKVLVKKNKGVEEVRARHVLLQTESKAKEIIKSIEFMKDENEMKFFNHYKNDINYRKTIEEKLFLIELKYKLTKNPPDKMVFVELVEKTKKMLKECVPNRKDHHENIDNILDTELMATYINNDIMDNTYFFNIIQIIIDKVKIYQAEADDIELEEFRYKCTNSLNSNEFYKNFIPMFFIEILKRLDKIIVERETFIKLLNKK